MAPYVEPTTNKSSFRFGSQLCLLKDLAAALRQRGSGPSSWVGVWMVGRAAGSAGGRAGVRVRLPAGVRIRAQKATAASSEAVGRGSLEHCRKSPKVLIWAEFQA